jgi:hypothetical protein
MNVFFSPSAKYCSAIDLARDGRGAYSGKTLDDFRAEYPDIQIVDEDVSIQHDRNRKISPPREITEDEYTDLLECLPPCKWGRGEFGGSAFHVSERITYDIVTWCVKLGDKHYRFDDTDKINATKAVQRVRDTLKESA